MLLDKMCKSYIILRCIMLNFIKKLFKDFFIFTAAYSNNSFPEPLSKEEEDIYVKKANLGDKEAREKLIEHNLRLVAHIVKKYDNNKEDTDDLISIGTIGLIKGVDSYSKKKNTRLTTYAARCIENATFTSKNFLIELMHYLNKLELNYNFLTR